MKSGASSILLCAGMAAGLSACATNAAVPGVPGPATAANSVASIALANQRTPARSQARGESSKFGKWFYTCDGVNCYVYKMKSKYKLAYYEELPGGSTTDLWCPSGNVTTTAGLWYISNNCYNGSGAGTTVVYQSTTNGPSNTGTILYAANGGTPIDVAVDEKRDFVVVANSWTSQTGHPDVDVFVNGATTPVTSLTSSGNCCSGPYLIAVDGLGNCYWSDSEIYRFNYMRKPGYCGGGPISNNVGAAWGLAFDTVSSKKSDMYLTWPTWIFACGSVPFNCQELGPAYSQPHSIKFGSKFGVLWMGDVGTQMIYAVDPGTGQAYPGGSNSIGNGGIPYYLAPGTPAEY